MKVVSRRSFLFSVGKQETCPQKMVWTLLFLVVLCFSFGGEHDDVEVHPKTNLFFSFVYLKSFGI